MNRIREYQQHVVCDDKHDLYFLSSFDIEGSQYLFNQVDASCPAIRIDIESRIPVQSYETYIQFISDLIRYGKFTSDNSNSCIRIPDETDLRETFSGGGNPVYKFIGLGVQTEGLKFALLDRIRYQDFWNARDRSGDPDNDEEIPIDYGIWLNVPREGLCAYDFHIMNDMEVVIKPSTYSIEIVEQEKHYLKLGASQVLHTNETIYTISGTRDESKLAVVNVKEIRR